MQQFLVIAARLLPGHRSTILGSFIELTQKGVVFSFSCLSAYLFVLPDAGAIPRSPTHMSAMQQQNADNSSLSWDDSEEEEEEEDSASAAWAAMNLPKMDDATRQLILKSIKANAASDEEEDEEELLQMLSQPTVSEGATDLPQEAASAPGTMATASTTVADAQAVAPQTTNKLQADDNSMVPQELSTSSIEHGRISDVEDAPTVSQIVKLPPRKVDADSLEGYDQWDQNYWRDKEPEAVDATLAAAQVWSRIIRTPRKRGKHIILDVCSPQMHGSEAVDTSHGHLVRQVVATTDKKTWLGPGGYRLARKSRWGDLWPKFYQDYALTHKLS